MLTPIALLINAILFLPQTARITKGQTSKTVALLLILGYLFTQTLFAFHGLLNKELWVITSYLLSILISTLGTYLYCKYFSQDDEISLAEIIEQLPGHVYWKDKEGAILGSNKNNWKDFGLKSLQHIKGKTDYDIFPLEQAEKLRQIDKNVVFTRSTEIAIEESTKADGTLGLYLSHKIPLRNRYNEIQGIIGVSLDITNEHKATTQRLDMLENIIALMPGHVYWVDKNGYYLGCNDNQAKSAGLSSRHEIVGKRNKDLPWNYSTPTLPSKLDNINDQVMTSGKTINLEEPATLLDGSEATFLSNKVPLFDRDNQIIGMVGISIDITERKKHEVLLKEAKERTEQINKNVTQAAHDIRSPLAALSVFVQTLGSLTESERVMMRRAINRINDIAHDLLEKNRMIINPNQASSIKEETLSKELLITLINTLVTEKRLEFKHKTNIAIDLNIDNNAYGCFALLKPSVFKRILSNLINNAVEAIAAEGKITLTITKQDEMIALKIHDNGKGIPPEILARLGEIGLSHGKETGNGLGVYHAKETLISWGGTLHAESKLGFGTTMTIQLPMTTPPTWFPQQVSINPKDTIVVLDDDPSIHQIWDTRLRSIKAQKNLDFRLHHFVTTNEFLDWYHNNKPCSQSILFLFDYELSDCRESGFDILRAISGNNKILVTSHFDDNSLRAKCEKFDIKLMSKDIAGFIPIAISKSKPDTKSLY